MICDVANPNDALWVTTSKRWLECAELGLVREHGGHGYVLGLAKPEL